MPDYEDKEYEILEDGNAIVRRLRERYPKILYAVDPDKVIVLAITNKPRPFSMKKLAVIHLITPAMRTIIKALGRKDVRYYIEIFLTDWHLWGSARRQWICFHELLHIPHEGSKGLVPHDLMEFRLIVDYLGISTYASENIPDMLDGHPLSLNETLMPRSQQDNDESEDDH